ncbi:MAG TPA: response regulator [Herbaspirillum sp.]
MRILKIVSIVDDDEFVRSATSSLVRSFGWRISAFESAIQFLGSDAIKETECLICDVQMPGMTGLELQRYLNERKILIPTVFITGYPSDRLREELIANGALCLLEKPLDSSELAFWLKQILANR